MAITNLGSSRQVGSIDATERFHSLDAVRAFALLLGVFFHASESFWGNIRAWAVVDCSPSAFLRWCGYGSHSFRMPLFFLIAGFFARLVLQKKGVGGFVRNRVSRILVPLVVGWVVLYPIVVALWIWGKSRSGELGSLGIPPESQGLSPALLALGFFLHLGFIKRFDLTHLWFLHQLLVVYGVFLGLRQFCIWVAGRWPGVLPAIDRAFGWGFSSRWNSLVLGLLTVPMFLMMRLRQIDTPTGSLIPYLPTTLLYGWSFAIGWFLHRQPELLEKIRPQWGYHLAVGVVLTVGMQVFGDWLWGKGHAFYAFGYGVMMWSFSLGFMALFVRFCSGYSAWRRYVADSAYWIYLVHLPLVVALQIVVGKMPVAWEVKYPAVLLVAFTMLFLSYQFLVRDTFVGKQLNGRRYPIGGQRDGRS